MRRILKWFEMIRAYFSIMAGNVTLRSTWGEVVGVVDWADDTSTAATGKRGCRTEESYTVVYAVQSLEPVSVWDKIFEFCTVLSDAFKKLKSITGDYMKIYCSWGLVSGNRLPSMACRRSSIAWSAHGVVSRILVDSIVSRSPRLHHSRDMGKCPLVCIPNRFDIQSMPKAF